MICSDVKFPIKCSFDEHLNIIVSHVDNINESVKIVFDLIEVPMVLFSDLWRNISLANPVNVFSRNVNWSDVCIEHAINRFYHLSMITGIFGKICPDV
ncbi:MAG: hypothetical protein BWY45_02250 [Euryarchaeota archaeon ADurb.Bin294]|nr:MAG: hypothetical protein BWY45_02250 [Euryarchaeota archaeon ADurb.Bin294]